MFESKTYRDGEAYEGLIMIGDIHGEFWVLDTCDEHKNFAYIQVGDFGVGFYGKNFTPEVENKNLAYINNFLKEGRSKLFVVRGNHDDPSFFKEKKKYDFSNIIFVEDYTVLELIIGRSVKRILCIGGAVSLDRKTRLENVSWFKDEEIILNDEVITTVENIDAVVAHICPMEFYPFTINDAAIVQIKSYDDSALKTDLHYERNQMTVILETLLRKNKKTLKYWVYGHYHQEKTTYFNDVKGILLGINQFYELIF